MIDSIKNVLLIFCLIYSVLFSFFVSNPLGQGGANPANIADAMVDAVADFVEKNKPVHVKFVKFLIFQTNMVEHFHQSMIRRSGEKVEEDKSLFTTIKGQYIEFKSKYNIISIIPSILIFC